MASQTDIHLDWDVFGEYIVGAIASEAFYSRFMESITNRIHHGHAYDEFGNPTDDYMTARADHDFAVGLHERLRQIGYYTPLGQPPYPEYSFYRWMVYDMILIRAHWAQFVGDRNPDIEWSWEFGDNLPQIAP